MLELLVKKILVNGQKSLTVLEFIERVASNAPLKILFIHLQVKGAHL